MQSKFYTYKGLEFFQDCAGGEKYLMEICEEKIRFVAEGRVGPWEKKHEFQEYGILSGQWIERENPWNK